MEKQEKKNRAAGIYISVGVHALLLLVFSLMFAWTAPDPPIEEYGIELNMGSAIAADSGSDEPIEAEEPEEQESLKETTPEVENSEPDQSKSVESNSSAVEEVTVEVEEEAVQAEDIHSPDEVEVSNTNTSDVPEVTNESEVNEKEAVEDVEESTEEAIEEPENSSLDKAKAEPEIDNRAIYKGNTGGNGSGNKGASLDLSGWMWDFKPKPDDRSSEEGLIVFEIKVDSEGEIIGIRTVQKTVSPVVERVYRDAVMDLTFSKTGNNQTVAPSSTGRITFIIQSK